MRFLGLAALIALSGVASAAAADLPSRIVAKVPARSDPGYQWGGWYVGGHAGGVWGRSDVGSAFVNGTTPIANQQAFAASAPQLDASGFAGGGQVGYNHMVDRWLFGVEVDASYSGLRASRAAAAPFPTGGGFAVNYAASTPWTMTLRPRIGYAIDRTLLYATGGLALTDLNFASAYADSAGRSATASVASVKTGWTAGIGIEHAISTNWSAKVEYLYTDFGKLSVSSPLTAGAGTDGGVVQDIALKTNTVRGGLNYRFGGPPVARN